jgi:hypothetical protein
VRRCELGGDARLRTARCGPARWLEHVQLWSPREQDEVVTGEHETAVVVLGGTFDLVGGATAWPARGARVDPFTGRPMAVFLPPRTVFRAQNGRGELLLVAARQPAATPAPTGRDALAHKPLLPLAGSGKAFDPSSGEWKPAETFPSAPESLPPRRFLQLRAGACTIERMLAPDYKAATLCVDEVVVPAGAALDLDAVPERPRCDELALFVRGHGAIDPRGDGARVELDGGDAVVLVPHDSLATLPMLHATTRPLYAVLAWAGKPT